jgi:hypothetical protein
LKHFQVRKAIYSRDQLESEKPRRIKVIKPPSPWPVNIFLRYWRWRQDGMLAAAIFRENIFPLEIENKMKDKMIADILILSERN